MNTNPIKVYLDYTDGILYTLSDDNTIDIVRTNANLDPSKTRLDEDGYLYLSDFNDNEHKLEFSLKGDKGEKGDKGDKGDQGGKGDQGEKGEKGDPVYTWIKYADDQQGKGISDSPVFDGKIKAYIGFAYNKNTPTESSDASDYTWSQIKGTDGVPGEKGADGTTYYTWIKYSDKTPESNDDIYDTPTENTEYIGIATNQTKQSEGSDYTLYTWSKFKGDQGVSALSLNLSNDFDQVYVTNGIVTTTQTITTQISLLSGSSSYELTSSNVSVEGDTDNIQVVDGSNGIITITVTFVEGTDLSNIPSLHYYISVDINGSVINKEFSIIVLQGSVDYDLKISPSVIKFVKKTKEYSTQWLSVYLTEQELTAKNIGRNTISSIPEGYSLTYSRDNGSEQELNQLGDESIQVYNSTVTTADSVTVYLRKGEELIDKVTVEVVKEGSDVSLDYDEYGNLRWKSDFEDEYKNVSDSYLAVRPLMYLPPLAKEGAFVQYLGPTRPAIKKLDHVVEGVTELECGRIYMNATAGTSLYYYVAEQTCLTPSIENFTIINIDGRSAATAEWIVNMQTIIEERALDRNNSELVKIYNYAQDYGNQTIPFTALYHIIVTKDATGYELVLEPWGGYKDDSTKYISLDSSPFNVFMHSDSLTGIDGWLREEFSSLFYNETIEYHFIIAFVNRWVSKDQPLWKPL